MNIVWSNEAKRSLRAIHRYIAADSKFYATRMIARIVERAESIATAPLQGHAVHEYPEAPLREVHESPYRIVYRLAGESVQIVTIVHFKQRLQSVRLRKR